MSDSALEDVTKKLQESTVSSNGVSFQGKGLKLDTEDDCKEVVEAIKACKNLEYLNLEGNTLGVDAAKALSQVLSEHGELKRALWKDMFTGRMKTEIPKALESLGGGLFLAGAQLTELDLSDNAFGPIGVEGLAGLLSSPVCYSLQELRLNNNGLGITGGKMLARALLDCHEKSSKTGKALGLKLFIAGRNRLENEGAEALSKVFQKLGTLEEIAMPQNGIYHVGIKALSQSLTNNPNLKSLNLNDNTVTEKGATSIAQALPHLQKLKILNLGDCLLRTGGATVLANALAEKHLDLEEVHLGYNEIKIEGGLAIARAMKNKDKLKELTVNGNQFGESGKAVLIKELEDNKRIETLGTLSDDESGDDEDEENHNEDTDDAQDEDGERDSENENSTVNGDHENSWVSVSHNQSDSLIDIFQNMTVDDKSPVLKSPKAEKILKTDKKKIDELTKNKESAINFYVNDIIPALMEISAQINDSDSDVRQKATDFSMKLYNNIFAWASENEQLSTVNNSLFVHLGLIKSEEKNFKIYYNIEACLAALRAACSEGIVPNLTQQILNCCLDRKKVNHNR